MEKNGKHTHTHKNSSTFSLFHEPSFLALFGPFKHLYMTCAPPCSWTWLGGQEMRRALKIDSNRQKSGRRSYWKKNFQKISTLHHFAAHLKTDAFDDLICVTTANSYLHALPFLNFLHGTKCLKMHQSTL